GPVGHELREAVGDGLGDGRYLVPVALCAIGALLLRGRPPEDPTAVTLGFALLVTAGCGLLELAHAGGAFGRVVERPLEHALAGPGTALVLATVVLFGLLLVTRTPLRSVPGLVHRAFRW